MIDSTEVLIGRIAVSSGMISNSQLEEIIASLDGSDGPKLIEDMLLEEGTVSKEQALVLRRLREHIRNGRNLFGQVAVERGFITVDQLDRARARQVDLEKRGKLTQIGAVMVEMGLITPQQVARILERQKKTPMMCGVCNRTYQILPGMEEKARCPKCNVRLAAPEVAKAVISEAEATQISETIEAEPEEKVERPTTPEHLTGKVVAGCKILELIGKGSMGTVYRGKHLALGREVAIKMLPATGRGQLLVRRLIFEARAIAKLSHENIVGVHDAGLGKGHLFLVMELINGQSLDEMLKESGAIMEEQATAITRDILKGLQAAHGAGIVHRDLKPANIMIEESGRGKIMDFGLALDQDAVDDVEGMIVGTPYYMSPEQWLGQKADERSDLYALGIILYNMLTGRKPFDSSRVSDLMRMHLKKAAVSPIKLKPTLSRGVVAVVRKAMSKRPRRRYGTATDFLNDIARVEAGEEPEALDQFGTKVKCGFCETYNPEGSTRCTVCNEALSTQKAGPLKLAARKDEFKCPACRGFVQKGSRTCPNCTRPFCRHCLRRLVSAQGYCEVCLAKSKIEEQRRSK